MPNLPEPSAFYISTPLYQEFPLLDNDLEALISILFFQDTLDVYCPHCGRESVFSSRQALPMAPPQLQGVPVQNPKTVEELLSHEIVWISTGFRTSEMFNLEQYVFGNRTVINSFSCSRNADHLLEFVLKTYNGTFQKIGQSPSLADLQKTDIAKYRNILGREKSAEFTKAIGLSAHGVGIGSFVYLRRIFEDLVEQAHQDALKDGGWNEEAYTRSRMAEKILLLKNHLPGFLVENRDLYSILSVGVHSLTEEDCLKYFEAVKMAIELILDEKIEKQEKERKVSSTGKILAAIKSSFSSK